jgi:hypothetical protein
VGVPGEFAAGACEKEEVVNAIKQKAANRNDVHACECLERIDRRVGRDDKRKTMIE